MTNSKSDLCFNWFFIQDFDLINFQYFINHKNICIYYPFRKHKMLGYLAYIGLNGILKSLFSSSSNPHFLFLLLHMALCLELLATPTLLIPDIWLVEKCMIFFQWNQLLTVHIWDLKMSLDASCKYFKIWNGGVMSIIFSFHKWWKGKTKISLGWREFRESVGEREEVSFTSSILKRSFTE